MSITSRINEMSSHIEQAYDELQGLGADLTNVNKNIENISMVLDDIYDSLPSVSGEGTSLTLEDTRVGKIKSTLKGNTSQSGTPTPTSPIPINVVSGDNEIVVCGKNLHDFSYWIQNINQGTNITYSNRTDSSVNITASARGYTAFGYNQQGGTSLYRAKVEPNTEYTFSYNGEFISGTQGIGTFVFMANTINGDYTTLKVKDVSTSVTFTTTSTTNYIWFRIDLYNACTYRISNIQLEKGSSATTYEPYQGNTYNIDLPEGMELCKIGNYQDYFGKSDGRNLFNKSTITTSAYLKEDGTLQTGTGAEYITSDFIPVKPNTTYYKTQTLSPRTKFYDKNKQVLDSSTYQDISIGGNAGSFTTPNNAYYFRFTGNVNASTGININTTMVNEGSSALPYQPYGVGKWYLHKEIGKVVLNGSENITTTTYSAGAYFHNIINIGLNGTNNDYAMSNYYTYSSSYMNNTCKTANGGKELVTRDNFDQSTYITWLGTNKPIFYYLLATPTTTEITYQPLIDQLNLLEKAMSKDGQTNISQVNNDLPFIISASAFLNNINGKIALLNKLTEV